MRRLVLMGMFASILLLSVNVGAQADRLQVVASYSILADVVANVAGDAADVRSLIPVGADPHTFEPTPRDLISIAEADIVFTNGAGFEEGLLAAIENAGEAVPIVVVSDCVDVIPFGFSHDDDHADDDHADDDHADDDHSLLDGRCADHTATLDGVHAGDDDHRHDDPDHTMGKLYRLDCDAGHAHNDDHDHGGCDPHVWMNPHNVMLWALMVRDTLTELDPANAATYRANADAYLIQLEALVHEFIEPMVETLPEASRILVTNHESLGYFAAEYDFEIVTTFLPGGATAIEPSLADVAATIDTVQAAGVPAVFAETTVRNTVAAQIANETGAELYVLYSGSLSEPNAAAGTYLDYMRYNVTTIVEALGGGM